jgi:carbon monoxide dehydrogenase subunit G
MKFTYAIPLDRPADVTWEALQDATRLIRCIPGCEDVAPAADEAGALEAGVEVYNVRMATGLGPIRLRAAGTARVRRDSDTRSMTADISLTDSRSGTMYGTMALAVREADVQRSEIRLDADVVLASKIGEFAQPLLRHKADQTVKEFVRNLLETFPAAG